MNKLPDINTQFSEWYNEIIGKAELADQAPVRGCIVIRPYGNAIWELIKAVLDQKFKETGHQNALFPLLIPESFLKKEVDHIEGFAPEIAVVTHAGGKKLAEPLVVRPTSETIIHYMFAQWIKSWRDLPLKINQWANVVRWEMRPRAFLRTTEFFWQEGHTAHATKEEALEEVLLMIGIYEKVARDYLAIPVIVGEKPEGERFPGAEKTYTFEGFMPDGKALQMGTSHLLSQNFAKAFEMQFQDQESTLAYPWLTSWGCTTRLIGAVIMVHGDNKGLVLPPAIAPIQVVIIPIFKTDQERESVLASARTIKKEAPASVRIQIDEDDQKTPGNKFYHWELRGVPIRLEIGPRDVQNEQAILVNRLGTKTTVPLVGLGKQLPELLQLFQDTLYKRAQERFNRLVVPQQTLAQMVAAPEGNAFRTGFCNKRACEDVVKEHKMSIRCLIAKSADLKSCFNCGQPSVTDCIIARSY